MLPTGSLQAGDRKGSISVLCVVKQEGLCHQQVAGQSVLLDGLKIRHLETQFKA